MKYRSAVLVLLLSITTALAQVENAQPRIAPALVECYRQGNIYDRNQRLPMTPNMLIELIRKVEDTPGFNQDIRQLAVSLVHRFRQDGIIPAPGLATNQADILPFSPRDFTFAKHRVLLTRLVPGNAGGVFPNNTLTVQERCTLHFMLSTSIETRVRGDEATRCNQLSQYRSARLPRDASKNQYVGDVETIKTSEMKRVRDRLQKNFGRYENEDGEAEGEEEPATDGDDIDPVVDEEEGAEGEGELDVEGDVLVDLASNQLSQCPVENGVLFSPWGAISGGPLITGIAAGLTPQNVTVRELNVRSGEYRSAKRRQKRQVPIMLVDNRFAATLSGDLSEVVLLQAPGAVQVGVTGAWNNTAVPRWFFLSQRERVQMTDAEIRGGLDGLILASNIADWRNRAQNLRLSQVLDMYYSQRGVFNPNMRSCNRAAFFTTHAPIQTLRDQVTSFTNVLDVEMQTSVTFDGAGIQRFSTAAADALASYIPTMNDVTCEVSFMGDGIIRRSAADIYIFIDTTWPFIEIQPIIAHLLDNLDVHRFGTNYTLLNALDGTLIVNSTNQLTELYNGWNQTVHIQHPQGLDLPNVLQTLRVITQNLLIHEQMTMQVGGRSKIALIVPQIAAVNEAHRNVALDRLRILREDVPDLRVVFFSGGTESRFDQFVREPSRDIFPLRPPTAGVGADTVRVTTFPVIQRVQQEPRRIINPRCGTNWWTEVWGNNQLIQHVEPNGIIFYRIHPNYFFGWGNNQRVRISGAGFAPLTVCYSRTIERPMANSTNVVQNPNDEQVCSQVNTNAVEIDLSNACGGHEFIHRCPPLFFSVQGPPTTSEVTNLRCIDATCRFPDDARFTIHTENLGCHSGAATLVTSFLLLAVSIFMTLAKL